MSKASRAEASYERNKALEARLKAKIEARKERERERERAAAAKKAKADEAKKQKAATREEKKEALKEAKKRQASQGGPLIVDKSLLTERQVRGFEKRFAELSEYKKEYGNCNVPFRFSTPLGYWVSDVRNGKYPIDEAQHRKLQEAGFVFESLRGAHHKATLTQAEWDVIERRKRSEGRQPAMIHHQENEVIDQSVTDMAPVDDDAVVPSTGNKNEPESTSGSSLEIDEEGNEEDFVAPVADEDGMEEEESTTATTTSELRNNRYLIRDLPSDDVDILKECSKLHQRMGQVGQAPIEEDVFNCDFARLQLVVKDSSNQDESQSPFQPLYNNVYSDRKRKIQKIKVKRHSKDVKVLLKCLTPFIKELTGLSDEEGAIIQELAFLQTEPGAHRQQLHFDFHPESSNIEKTFFFIIPMNENGSLYVHSPELKKVSISLNKIFIGRGDLAHAGSEDGGLRLHGYVTTKAGKHKVNSAKIHFVLNDNTFPATLTAVE